MQSTSGQVDILEIEPRSDQINYVKQHWYIEGIEKMVKGSGLTAQQVYYTAFTILRLKPRKIGLPRGNRGYSRIEDIKTLRVLGSKGKFNNEEYLRLPRIVKNHVGFGLHEEVPTLVKEDDRKLVVTLYKKGTVANRA